MTTLLGISGSLRAASFNTLLVKAAATRFDPDTFVLGDLRLPLYDGDLEKQDGIPEAVQLLSDQIAAADAVVISTPEYNSSIPGVLKNALDWISRTDGSPWRDKPVAILSAAAGRTGGARAQFVLRNAMTPFRTRILQGPEVMVAGASKQFDDSGALITESYDKLLTELMTALRGMT